jgi:hypothetical protein
LKSCSRQEEKKSVQKDLVRSSPTCVVDIEQL